MTKAEVFFFALTNKFRKTFMILIHLSKLIKTFFILNVLLNLFMNKRLINVFFF